MPVIILGINSFQKGCIKLIISAVEIKIKTYFELSILKVLTVGILSYSKNVEESVSFSTQIFNTQ